MMLYVWLGVFLIGNIVCKDILPVKSKYVAFSAYHDQSVNYMYNKKIQFRLTWTNAGADYIPATSTFHVQLPGYYIFSWTITSTTGVKKGDLLAQLLKARLGGKLISLGSVSIPYVKKPKHQSSATVVVYCSLGDQVFVMCKSAKTGCKTSSSLKQPTMMFSGAWLHS